MVPRRDQFTPRRSARGGKFANAVYVLHVFQKKSTKGIKTAKGDIDLIRQNLKTAEADSKAELKSKGTSDAKRT